MHIADYIYIVWQHVHVHSTVNQLDKSRGDPAVIPACRTGETYGPKIQYGQHMQSLVG